MNGDRDAWGKVGQISAFGLTTGVAMFVCGWLGLAIDRWIGTTPVFAVVLFLAGGASALWYGILKILR